MIWSQSGFTVFRPSIPKTRANVVFTRVVAERVGVEPTCGFTRNSISSRARYGHFDTAPRLFPPRFTLRKLERKPGEKARGSNLSKARKALKTLGFQRQGFRMEYTISSQGRYDHFDTAPRAGTMLRPQRHCSIIPALLQGYGTEPLQTAAVPCRAGDSRTGCRSGWASGGVGRHPGKIAVFFGMPLPSSSAFAYQEVTALMKAL